MEKAVKIILAGETENGIQEIDTELRKAGFRPKLKIVDTQDQFCDVLNQSSWDIVISDYEFSQLNGFDAIHIIKDYKLDLPVIVISDRHSEEEAIEAVNAGASDYILRDKLVRLIPSIKRELKQSQQRKQFKRTSTKLKKDSMQSYGLFEQSPTPLWLEDFSQIKIYLDNLKAAGVTNFQEFINDNPGVVVECLNLLRIIDVSKETLKLYQASRKEEIINNPSVVFEQNTFDTFKEEIISLAQGGLSFQKEIVTKTLKGERRYVLLKLSVMPGYEKNLAQVLVSTTDITDRKNTERELRIKDAAFASSLTGIGIEDLKGHLTYVNAATINMWGYDNESAVLGKNGIGFWHDWRKARSVFKEILRNGKWNGELVGRKKDGTVFDVQVSATLITDEAGEPSLVMGSFEDITERKTAEKAIKESEAVFHALFENNQAIILLLDVDDKDLPIVDANEAAVRYYGYPKEQLLQKTMMEINALPANEVRKKMAAGRKEHKTLFEFKHRLASGELRDVETYSGPIDVQGRKLVYIAIQDISERKKMEKALLESEDQFRTIFENAPVGIAMVGLDDTILKANRSYCETLGYSEKELQRKKFNDFTHPYDLEVTSNLQQQLFRGEIANFEVEQRLIKRDGSVVDAILRVSIIRDSDRKPLYFLAQVLDISERKKAEGALRESEERYRNLAENSPNAIVVHSEGKIVYYNNQTCNLLGFDANEKNYLGTDVLQFVHPDSRIMVGERIKHIYEKRQVPVIEEKFIRSDGKTIDVEVAAVDVNYKGKPASQVVFRDITFKKRVEQVQNLLYKISNAVFTAEDSVELLEIIKTELSKIIDTKNFSLVLYDKESDSISTPITKKTKESYQTFPAGKSLISYVIKNKRPLLATRQEIEAMSKQGEISAEETTAKVWLGVPLKAKNEVIGAIVVQSFTDEDAYGEDELEILKFASDQIGLSIERKQTDEKIKASLEEKIVLLKEIHHRVKNNLQVISSLLYLQSKYLKDKDSLAVFLESQNRVRSMSLVHEKLYQSENLAKINLRQYLQDLTRYLFRSYNIDPERIQLKTKIDNVALDIDSAIPLGLIINELVSNSLKYAFPENRSGEVCISLKATRDAGYLLKVTDNGIGIKKYLDEPNKKSLGLQLVDTLVDQLQGRLEIEGKHGTEFKIRFTKREK